MSRLAPCRSASVVGRQRQIAREADQPGQPLAVAQRGLSAIAPPWREAGQRRCAPAAMPRAFSLRDQRLDQRLRGAHAGLVLALRPQVEAEDVVPGAHDVAAVDRHRPLGACGKTKRTGPSAADRARRTIGTKSLPSAPRPCRMMIAARGVRPGFVFDRFEGHLGSRCAVAISVRGAIRAPSCSEREVVVDHQRRVIGEALVEVDLLACAPARRCAGVARW